MQMIALHKNGLDVFSALCYFFEIILPALQGSAAVSAVRCSMERMIPSSVLPLSRSSSFFTEKLLVPVRRMMRTPGNSSSSVSFSNFRVGSWSEYDAAVKLRQRGGEALLQAKLYYFVRHGGLPLTVPLKFYLASSFLGFFTYY